MTGIGKITAKGQTTVPREIREAMNVKPGDFLAWDVGPDGVARVRGVQPLDLEYLRAVQATLDEWASPADEEAYHDL